MYVPDKDALFLISPADFQELHSIHWGIECYHRAIKQVCGIDLFMVRTSEAIKTHFFSAIRAFTQLELMRTEELIENWYEVQRNLSLQVARDFIPLLSVWEKAVAERLAGLKFSCFSYNFEFLLGNKSSNLDGS
jgi:Transposase DDE domain